MKVVVVIPNLNGADMIALALKSLEEQSEKAEIIVIDNASTDDSIEIIEKKFPEVVLIKNAKNTGFAGGVNSGIRTAIERGAEAVALFNNDAIADKNWLKSLVDTMKSEKAGIVTGKFMRDDKVHFDSTGDFYSVYGIGFPRGRNQPDEGQYDEQEEVFGASGGASLYSVEMLNAIGLFDERFFAYFEDVDISFRARLAGWKIVYQPKAVAYHRVGATSSKLGDFTRYHSVKNFLIIYTKNMPSRLYWRYLPKYLYQFLRTTARSIIDLKSFPWLKAVFAFIGYLPGILKDRRRIQSRRKISVEEIDSLLYKPRPPKIPVL